MWVLFQFIAVYRKIFCQPFKNEKWKWEKFIYDTQYTKGIAFKGIDVG